MKTVKLRYKVISALFSYNIIIDWPYFNAIEEFLSTLYLTMKYTIISGLVRVINGNQELVRQCYQDNLKMKKTSIKNSCRMHTKSTVCT